MTYRVKKSYSSFQRHRLVEMACYRASTNFAYDSKGILQQVYPPPPTYSPSCPVNVDYDTLPPGYPMRKTGLGPTSLKHLYRSPVIDKKTGKATRYYPVQEMMVPKGSMYEYDSGKLGPQNTRVSYGAKMFPYQHRHPREISEFTPGVLPYPDQREWTTYTTVSDGAWGK